MSKFTADKLAPVEKLYKDGLYLQAYKAATQLAPLADWTGGLSRVLSGGLATQLGAPRMGLGHHLLAFREDPDEPEVKYYYVWAILRRRGPYDAWRLLQKLGEMPEASPQMRAFWYALHAQIAGSLRDFDTAELWQTKAEETAPEEAWIFVTRSSVLQFEDRFEEALEAAHRALFIRPWYRPAVQAVAHLQTQLGQDEVALETLAEADNHIECAAVVHQLIGLLVELRRYSEAKNWFERLIELMPLMEKEGRQWFASMQADVAYFLNDYKAAISFGRESGNPFLERIAERLAEPSRQNGRRVSLPLAFVRQHYQTCVPATLTTISRFWSRPAEHLEIADQICYNGTTAHNERRWAEQNGWLTREFTVTEKSLVTLIDRGVPFTLTTIMPGNAHLQAVMGYDSRRGTMLVRDPYIRHTGEALIEQFLQQHGATGPRGMALVPVDVREKLDPLELPDSELWDQLHEFDGLLERHRWREAEWIYQSMVAQAPDHRLTLEARRRLTIYDANPLAILEAVESLLEYYPDDPMLHLSRLFTLSELSRREELLDAYKTLSTKKDSHPVFIQQYAQVLGAEAHEHERSIRLLRRAIRKWPTEGGSYFILANILWEKRWFEDALELYRFAICLKDKEEQFAQAYFEASRQLEKTDEALAFLKRRWERFGRQSSLTARTLAWAYGQLGRWPEAINTLENALTQHPKDGELTLWAANLLAQASPNNLDRANELLAAAKPHTPRREWLRMAARLAAIEGNPDASLLLWQNLLEIQPLAMDAHRMVVHLLTTTQNPAPALEHIQAYTDRFPHYYPLRILQADWYRDRGWHEDYLTAARKLVKMTPKNDKAYSYLGQALWLNMLRQDAIKAFETGFELNPSNIFSGLSLFDLQLSQDMLKEAAKTLTTIAEYDNGPLVTARFVQLALRQKDQLQAVERLKRLLVLPGENGWALKTAIEALDKAGMVDELLDALDEAVFLPEVNPEVGAYWMRACIHYWEYDCLDDLEELIGQGEVGRRAVEVYVKTLLQRENYHGLHRFIQKNRHWLCEDGGTWNLTAVALRKIGNREETLAWIRHWRHLQQLQPWMLQTAVEMFWEAGLMDEAAEASQRALLLPPDNTTAVHRLWLAAGVALLGEVEKAIEHLGMVNQMSLDPYSHFLYQLADAVIKISTAGLVERNEVFQAVREQIRTALKAVKKLPEVKPSHRHFYRQTLKHISRETGTLSAKIWWFWSYFKL